jgi:hypothetical protein
MLKLSVPVSATGTDYWEFVARADKKLTEQLRIAAGWLLAEHFKHRRVEQVRRRRYRRRPSSVKNPARRIRLVYHKRRLFLVRQPIAGAGWIPLARLRQLECRCYFHAQSLPSGPALLRYESFQGELFRFHGRSKRQTRGRADPLTNPEGLTSGWCSATVVAKFWFTLN